MRRSILLLVTLLMLAPGSALAGRKDLGSQLDKATEVLEELGPKVTSGVRKAARCVSVLVIGKGGFIVGGTGGRGFLTCRDKGGSDWSAPVVLDVGGGSAGAQIGGAKVEVVMVFTDVDDIREVATTTPVFQGQASATAGDEGVGVSAGGNPEAEAGVYTISRSEGLYAGATGEALLVNPDEEETAKLLGTSAALEKVLVKREVPVPDRAKEFVAAVKEWAAQ